MSAVPLTVTVPAVICNSRMPLAGCVATGYVGQLLVALLCLPGTAGQVFACHARDMRVGNKALAVST